MLDKDAILAILREKLPELRERFCVERIGVFGSFARGDQTETSDIDFVVGFRADCVDLFTVKHELRQYLRTLFGRSADLANLEYLKPYVWQDIAPSVSYVG